MKIGIDISQIVYGSGVSVYTENLVSALLNIDRENEYTLLFSSLRRELLEIQKSKFKSQNYKAKIKSFKIPPTLLDILWNRLHMLPVERLIGDIDVFHSSDWTQPPSRAKKVTTIHDLSFLRWPESVHPKVLETQKRRLEWVRKEVDAVIAVSEATKKETIELLRIPSEKISVIYEGTPVDALEFSCEDINLDKYGISKPYIIAYGSQAQRKNIGKLLESYAEIRKGVDCQLVIIGGYHYSDKLPDGVVATGFLPRKEMLSLMSRASCFAYPSLYEGFGLPILEAFALGVPVLTSNISSMPEVAGRAALLVNPEDKDEIGKGLLKILSDRKLTRELIKKGSARAKEFAWEKAARETLKIYESLEKHERGAS
jgi:glycosyltransferase involved in cell wall biosynthesis